ncbi:uncharacterized protein C2845_PM15G00290 [Panicum miliaceum]|uniref:Uncharacterized protein n=1 Tax=Panicum miliaceum TaxID=4540 RepID=A0A3L6Q5R1_PANMI|nr:uncharacterized protein C2845_PM15G00290 [Panicum miliaceum]
MPSTVCDSRRASLPRPDADVSVLPRYTGVYRGHLDVRSEGLSVRPPAPTSYSRKTFPAWALAAVGKLSLLLPTEKKPRRRWHRAGCSASSSAMTSSGEEFSGRIIGELPLVWRYGQPRKNKKRLPVLLDAIAHLKESVLTGIGVIGTYHQKLVAPLMARSLPMYVMDPLLAYSGIMLTIGEISASEVRQHVLEAIDAKEVEYPVPGYPVMLPDSRADLLDGYGPFMASPAPLPEDVDQRRVYRLQAEEHKKRKDEREKKKKEWEERRRDHAKHRKAGVVMSSESDFVITEEKEDDDDSNSEGDVMWDTLLAGDEEGEEAPPPPSKAAVSDPPAPRRAGGKGQKHGGARLPSLRFARRKSRERGGVGIRNRAHPATPHSVPWLQSQGQVVRPSSA